MSLPYTVKQGKAELVSRYKIFLSKLILKFKPFPGTMISCYLIYSKMVKNDIEALEFYGQKRTTDGKGVTIPSQRRYVNYFSRLINDNLEYRTKPLEVS